MIDILPNIIFSILLITSVGYFIYNIKKLIRVIKLGNLPSTTSPVLQRSRGYDTSLQPDAVDFSDVGSAEQERRREAFSALIGSPSDDDSETANDPLDMLANVAASQMPDSEYITQLRRDDPAAYQRWISENPEAAKELARLMKEEDEDSSSDSSNSSGSSSSSSSSLLLFLTIIQTNIK